MASNDSPSLVQMKLTDEQHIKLKMLAAARGVLISDLVEEAIQKFYELRERALPEKPVYILPLQNSRKRSFWVRPQVVQLAQTVSEADEVSLRSIYVKAAYEYLKDFKTPSMEA